MALSYKNLLNTSALKELGSGSLLKPISKNTAKYIKGYANDTAVEALANSLGVNKGLLRQTLGIDDKKLDAYDPYHTSDAKQEEFWEGLDGKTIQKDQDEDTNTFKRSLYSNPELGGYRQTEFWYEDPFVPSFELYFDDTSPLFNEDQNHKNCLNSFLSSYQVIDDNGYASRSVIWKEFKNVFFKIFEKDIERNTERNRPNKAYYISKIEGLENLNKKIINYPEDKIKITLNEDVSMISWYISELYNNLIYSYRNKRFMVPENVIRFEMVIKINEIREYQLPVSANKSSDTLPVDKNYINKDIKYIKSPKSQIIYTLHDCTFNFFESKNYGNDIEIGGYGGGVSYTPQSLTFDISYKSVTRSSKFPLINESLSIDAWENSIATNEPIDGTKQKFYNDLDRAAEKSPEKKGYLNQLLGKANQTVANQAINYMDNLENKLRDVRGKTVNGLLSQFNNLTTINKIEPDNVYNKNFNDRTSVSNFGKQLASGLLNDLTSTVRDATNF